jgi:5'-3' exoribonuclease 2
MQTEGHLSAKDGSGGDGEAASSSSPSNGGGGASWDSNVITPGTQFMLNLSNYLRFYIRKRLSTDKSWRSLRVIYSDASCPGEGEHKIMAHIRLQRCQPGYDPNLVHVLHGLDADLIMLALATHEAHFYISRELVTFGRRSVDALEQRQQESGFRDAQIAFDEAVGSEAMQMEENQGKPLQRISIPILREYWQSEFAPCLDPTRLPFAPNFERLIDDVVFLCFFVGNDFLPHLPSLDIRDGALDYLFNVYKRLLPSLGDYITSSGGSVNLSLVDVLLAEVGSIEDYVFQMKHENEQRMQEQQRQQRENNKKRKATGAAADDPLRAKKLQLEGGTSPKEPQQRRGRAARVLSGSGGQAANSGGDIVALSRGHEAKERARQNLKSSQIASRAAPAAVVQNSANDDDNVRVAMRVKELLMAGTGTKSENGTASPAGEEVTPPSSMTLEVDATADATPGAQQQDDDDCHDEAGASGEADDGDKDAPVNDTYDDDLDDDDDDDESKPELELQVKLTDEEAAAAFKERVKAAQQRVLDEHAKNVDDKVRLHESGWKDRYYADKCKADDVENHGGREHLFRSYVVGLCWVMKYYYDGCPSWKWYFPFHYAPFASDLRNIERFAKDVKALELNAPFNPVEQLMAVLPSDSAHAVPKASRWLMLDEESPIIDFYPNQVPVDPNGKAMPWLWVVLLPFIDEERLISAMSPTMAQWKHEELLCNSRGLDDGYLYVHKSHPLSRKLLSVLDGGKTAKAPKVRLTDSAAYGTPGFSGSLRPPLSHEIFPLDEETSIPPPLTASRIDSDRHGDSVFGSNILVNAALCVAFSEPPKLSHKSIMLPGARILSPLLTADDKRIRRPRLNRGGGTIANMGMANNGRSHQSGYGSMNISSYERDLAERTGRGAQMNQVGTRAWGAMEPAQKRVRAAAGVNLPNPFSFSQYPPAGPHYPPAVPQYQHVLSRQPPATHHQHPMRQQPAYARPQHGAQVQHPQYRQTNDQPQFHQLHTSQQARAHPQQQQWADAGGYQRHPQNAMQQPQGYSQYQHRNGGGGAVQYQQQHHHQQQHFQQSTHRPPAPPSYNPGAQSRLANQPPPQHQAGGFNFRSYNTGQQATPPPHQRQAPPAPAGADVMRNLKAQLSNTLNQSRQRK